MICVLPPALWLVIKQLFNANAGYGKLPDYEHMFTDFLLSVSKSEGRTGTTGSKFQLYMQYQMVPGI